MNKNLNAVGNCYKDNDHTLAKCEVPRNRFALYTFVAQARVPDTD